MIQFSYTIRLLIIISAFFYCSIFMANIPFHVSDLKFHQKFGLLTAKKIIDGVGVQLYWMLPLNGRVPMTRNADKEITIIANIIMILVRIAYPLRFIAPLHYSGVKRLLLRLIECGLVASQENLVSKLMFHGCIPAKIEYHLGRMMIMMM